MSRPVFLLHIYKDAPLAQRLVEQVRSLYPTHTILAIADGIDSPGFREFAAEMDVNYILGARLKLPQHGGGWLKRMFMFAAGKGDPLIKLDADAYMHRSIDYFPDADIAGTTLGFVNQRINIVRGGCVMYRQRAIARILQSGLLDDPCYRNPVYYAYRRFGEFRFPDEPENNELVAGEDCIIGHISKRLGLKMADWDEVRICFREAVPENVNNQWAITHPHRELI